MHKYLRAIGFSTYTHHLDICELLSTVSAAPDETKIMKIGQDSITCIRKNFGEDFGLHIWGEYDQNGQFQIQYFLPFGGISPRPMFLPATVERHPDKDAFSVLCEDFGMGMALIFYLQNPYDLVDFARKHKSIQLTYPIQLGALSTEGKILLPMNKTQDYRQKLKRSSAQRASLLESARKGDEEAMESLTMYDFELFNQVNHRLHTEDLYSIVDSTFMPTGIECDSYSILGEILAWRELVNQTTHEKLFELFIECNDLFFQVTINQKDLLGEPSLGRRFKGEIWMQGAIDFAASFAD